MKLTWTHVMLYGLTIGLVLAFGAYLVLTLIGNDVTAETEAQCLSERNRSYIVAWDYDKKECVRHEKPQWIEQDV
jgi:hypothetical protein